MLEEGRETSQRPSPGGARATGFTVAPALVLALCLLLLLQSGCGRADARSGGGPRPRLTVSVAASLRQAFPELGALFTRQTGAEVVVNSGASGVLAKQLAAGAPVDVFASASPTPMATLVSAGEIRAESVKAFASNELVLAVAADRSAGTPASPNAFAHLADPSVRRVAIGNPDTAPHGAAAMETLRHLGLLDAVQPKLVLTENVAQTRDYVARGEVDAGLLFASEARPGSGLEVLAVAPAGSHAPLVDVIGVSARAADPELARRFVEVVLSPEGQAILTRYGFRAPGETAAR